MGSDCKKRQYDHKSVVGEIEWTLFCFVAFSVLIVGLHFKTIRPASFKETRFIFIPHCIADLLLYSHPPSDFRNTSDLSNPSHRCPFHKPSCWVHHFRPYRPSFTSPTLCFWSFKDREPYILSHNPWHCISLSICLFLALSLSFLLSLLPSLTVH